MFGDIGAMYKVFCSQPLRFIDAAAACVAECATLGRISSVEEFFCVVELGDTLGATEETWIGVKIKGNDEDNDASNYLYVDGFVDNSFFAVRDGVFPWRAGRTSDNNGRNCVGMIRTSSLPGNDMLWNNFIFFSVRELGPICVAAVALVKTTHPRR